VSNPTDNQSVPIRDVSEAAASVLTGAERHQVLVEWNRTERAYPREKCVHQLFEEQVERTPDAVAVVFGGRCLTYCELNQRANQLAHHLIGLGVKPGTPVGICLLGSLEFLISVLAILKAGGIYVPLDPEHPSERLAFMVEDTKLVVLLTSMDFSSRLPELEIKRVVLGAEENSLKQYSRENPGIRGNGESLAYIIYTSGSTGTPKGVAVPHRAISRLVLNTNYIVLTAADHMAQVSNVAFDAATFEIWGALLNGGQLIVLDRNVLLSPEDLRRELRAGGVTVIFLTTGLFNFIARDAIEALAGVQTILTGGEAMSPQWARAVLERHPGVRLLNAYGPTENTTFTSLFEIESVPPQATDVPIGRPIANTQIYILDAQMHPVPIGVAGELFTGGDGLACGYWNQPALTAERFVSNPFSDGAGSRLYRTGDRCRWRADGTIDFLGRFDDQVKIRGFRVELSEVETALRRHPAVADAAVQAQTADDGTQELTAWIVARPDREPTISNLRSELAQWLPEYMIPHEFAVLQRLPLNPNGKLDRKALRNQEGIHLKAGTEYIAPRNDLERRLCKIWQEVLAVERLSIHDNFFDLGGHSLAAMRVLTRVQQFLGESVPVLTLFSKPTIAELASQLADNGLSEIPAGKWEPKKQLAHARCVHQLVEEQAERRPDAVAVVFAGQTLTYHELNLRANQLAHHLVRLGSRPDERVVLFLDRSPETVLGMLAVLKAGAAYVPVDPAYPVERVAFMLQDASARIVLTVEALRSRLPADVPVLCLDSNWSPIAEESMANIAPEINDQNLAYVIYTSGSTGRPKGVCMPHGPLLNLLAWQQGQSQCHVGKRTLNSTSPSFDVSFQEIFSTLCFGGSLMIYPASQTGDMAGLLNFIETEDIDRVFVPFVVLRRLAELVTAQGHAPASLREVITAGEQLQIIPAIRTMFEGGRIRLINQYGPTETHVVSFFELTGPVANWPALPPIGRPIPNVRLHILDDNHLPVPDGVPGELLVGGTAPARGYLNQESLTQERFIPDPFALRPGERLYCTGDLVRQLPSGEIEFLGRMDQQVKIRGYRIELGEIEAVLGDLPELAAAVVVAQNEEDGNKRLVAFVVLRKGKTATSDSLRARLARKLPDYMVPSIFCLLDTLPLTPNGKVDRKVLAGTKGVPLDRGTQMVPPSNETERQLCVVWQELLRTERISIHDNFFELGGHSLLAMRVIARGNQILGMRLSVRDLFEKPTIAELARLAPECPDDRSEIPIEIRGSAPPLSFAQERLWFLAEYEPESTAYHIPQIWRLKGTLRTELLEQALGELIHRHAVLRTTFQMCDGKGAQVVAPAGRFSLPVVDLTGQPQVESQVWRLIAESLRAPFDLATGPLLWAKLFRLSPQEQLLVVNMHHIVSDGWSLGVFSRELSTIYAALYSGNNIQLPPLRWQYADYTLWQRQWLQGHELKRQSDYWQRQLANAPLLELPTDFARPPRLTYAGTQLPILIPGGLARKLADFNRDTQVTPFMSLLAVFQVLLSRYSRQEDVLVGSPTANRQRVETEGLIGFFVNTLVMRGNLSGSPTFREFVRRVRTVALEAYQHQDLPFEELVKVLNPVRDLSRNPVFQVLFALQNAPEHPLQLTGLDTSVEPISGPTTHFDLELHLWQRGAEWSGWLVYNTDLFDPESIKRLADHYLALLESLLANPDQPVTRAEILTSAERRQVLVEWNRTEQAYPREKCVHQLLEEQVERTPEAVAVEYEGDTLTYFELNTRANRLANYLRGLGVGLESLVALCLDRSLEMVVGILGTMKAGAAYVPIDPAYPAERMAIMLADAQAPVILTQAMLKEKLPSTSAKVVCLDRDWNSIQLESGVAPVSGVTAGHLAYVIYTSGSTGQPKGVAMEHAPLVNLMQWHLCQTQAPCRTLQFASSSFDVSFQEMFSTWSSGGTLVLVDPQTRLNPSALWEFVAEQELERLFLPVVMLQHLAEASAGSSRTAPGLREIITAGEQLRITPAIRAFFDVRPECVLHNHYGPTESHVVTTLTLPPGCADWPDLPAIGRPIANATIYLLDAQMNPVPVGVPGEIYIGGLVLARGYWRQPVRTAECFIRNPFAAAADARLYRTGDLACWRPDGNLEFLGRLDSQVKIRGFRVELGEIESVLGHHPGVGTCVVVMQRDQTGEKSLTAFVVKRDVPALSVDSLRGWLAEKLPEHMIPARFVTVSALPLNANGKLDRKALEQLEGVALAMGNEHVAPRTELERQLAGLWQAVLRREQVGIRDNFFNCGGHSLLAAVLCSKIQREFGLEVTLRQVFEHPTVEQLARQMELISGQPQNQRAIEKADRQGPLPMSFGQQAMWLLQQTLLDAAAYNLSVAWRLKGPVDREKIKRSLLEIQSRHEVLRTGLVQAEGDLVQLITPATAIPLPWQDLDLRVLSSEQQSSRLEESLRNEARRVFDLAQAPLWRVMWVDLATDEHVLLFSFHHSIVDEWSLRLLFQELELLYAADGLADGAQLPELPVQYADYAVWQRQRLSGELLAQHRSYWREQLLELPPALELPLGMARPVRPSGRGAGHHFEITGPVVTKFRGLAREEKTTLFAVVLAAFQVWLHRYTGQDDIVVGTPISGRERPEVQALLGLFLNTLPIRVRLEGNRSFREVARQVRETLLDAFSHAELPFEEMVELAVKEREPGQEPLFQVMFVLLEEDLPDFQLGQARCRRVPVEAGVSKRDLTLSIEATGDKWECRFDYATDLFTPDSAASMACHLTELLRSISEDPERPICRLQLIPAEEQHRILVEWNQTERDYPVDKCAHRLFEEQVERTPEAVAVVFNGDSLNYRELNARANQLAHHLRSLGVGPDLLVGLCVERSLEMVVALLAILKAGGAYVPFDPKWPADRARLVMEDARLIAMVTRRAYADRLPSVNVPLVFLDDWPEAGAARAADNPEVAVSPTNLIYVLYTSGTTGLPKGVLIEHRQLLQYVWAVADQLDLSANGSYAMLQPLTVDSCQTMIFPALARGGTLHLIDEERALDAAKLADYFGHHRVDYLKIAPSHLAALLEQLPSAVLLPGHVLIIGGEASHWDFIDRLWSLAPRCAIWNHYGPTETTVGVTVCKLDRGAAHPATTVPIGRPLANVQTYILDRNLQPVPLGLPGELCLGGEQVARGYLDRAELTADRFLPDPFNARPNARLYRSGDKVRYLADGRIEFLGRKDQQVKIRGYRVELGEIETVLRTAEGVRDAVVAVGDTAAGGKRLKAFVVADGGGQLDDAGLRASLATRLPDYMIPSQFILLPNLPRTPHGKVDRKALEKLEGLELTSGTAYTAPRNERESKLVEIWQTVLNRKPVGIHDNFFDLGGSSLLAVSVQVRVEKELGIRLPLAAFFQAATVGELAQVLAEPGVPTHGLSMTGRQASPDRPYLFCLHHLSAAQRLAKHLDPHWPVYGVESPMDEELRRWHTRRELDLTLEELAARNVAIIQRIQPHGPYFLAGFCFGGVLAFEVARQLQGSGERVALLVLLDAAHLPGLKPLALPWLRRWAHHAGRVAKEGPGYVLKKWRSKLEVERRRSSALKTLLHEGGETNRTKMPEADWPRAEFLGELRRAYRGKAYPGSALLFRTNQGPSFSYDPSPTSGWDQVVLGGIQVADIECDHEDLAEEPSVGEVARKLLPYLLAKVAGSPAAMVAGREHVNHQDTTSLPKPTMTN
jgi:amino acid adenylation domain-containing protein